MHETVEIECVTPDTVRVVKVRPLVASVADTQELLGGISERTVYRLLDSGELESIAVGGPAGSDVGHGQGRRMVLLQSIRAYVRRQQTAAAASTAST